MTPTADTAQHPEVFEISDLTEGLLSPSRAEEVLRHIAGCDLCAEVRDSLDEIRGLLGTLPDPEPMPEDVATRIDAALAAEARPSAPTVDEPVNVSRETETGEARVGAAEAAGTAISRGASVGSGSGTSAPDRPAGRPSALTGPGRRPARRRRRAAILGTAFGAAFVGMSVFLLQSLDLTGDSSPTMADRGVSASDSGAHAYTDGTLEAQVQDLIGDEASQASPGVKKVPPNADTKSTGEAFSPESEISKNPMKVPAVAVPPCVQQATGRTTPALALDEGTYRGTDAYLVVLPHTSDPSRVEAYVVAASCVDTAPESTGQLLLTRAYDRP
ncbi:hypothetical protein CIB93_25125 [Streptomyces sp. WZ.A104]|uniref:anti-sigma factor family protein n=1 Tax=Streptomyces sp. WZ.A104 TaxID=2023771 RepID=UPI000BBBA1BF|nr:hypothetical protein [Streptomyces sp. WZ.A104]PCG83302.1 hypothetical protein CIB93_25125 [Streptomyces sp. WZ.A104]